MTSHLHPANRRQASSSLSSTAAHQDHHGHNAGRASEILSRLFFHEAKRAWLHESVSLLAWLGLVMTLQASDRCRLPMQGFIACLVNISEGAKAGKINARCRNTEALSRHVALGPFGPHSSTNILKQRARKTSPAVHWIGDTTATPALSICSFLCTINLSAVDSATQPSLKLCIKLSNPSQPSIDKQNSQASYPPPHGTPAPPPCRTPSDDQSFQLWRSRKPGSRFLFVFAGAGAAVLQPRRPSVSANNPAPELRRSQTFHA